MQNKILIFILILFNCVIKAQNAPYDEHAFEQIVKTEQRAHQGKLRNIETISAEVYPYDVKYYRCEWQLDPAVNYIKGAITTHFTPETEGFNEIKFDIVSALKVDSVFYHKNKVNFTQNTTNQLVITLPTISKNVLDSVTVHYQGTPPETGFGSFIKSAHNNQPIIWTLSEPFGASDWWPCKNGLTDKADSIDIIVTVPKGNKVGSNGLLVGETNSGNKVTYHWQHRYPIATYLIAIAVTNYASYSDFVPLGSKTLEVLNYVYPENLTTAKEQTKGIIPIIQLYDSLFEAYPFELEKYGHAQFGWGGGMEHQTMSFMYNFGHELMAHELAHQWFGDKITCGSWEDIWLNEGFATYLSGLTYEHMFNGQYWQQFKKSKIENATSQPGGSVMCTDTTNEDRIFSGRLTYNKGAMVLHQLRWVLGDAVFFKGIKSYLKDPQRAYSFAKTPQLKAHWEAAIGKNLDWYFKDWYAGEGFPSYQIKWFQLNNTLNINALQTQSIVTASFFKLPIQLKIKGDNRDTLLVFQHDFSGQNFTANIPFKITGIEFDPNLWLISANNTVTQSTFTPVNEAGDTPSVTVYPNPVSDILTVYFTEILEKADIKILDLTGKVLYNKPISGPKQHMQILVKDFPKGIYWLNIETNKGFMTKKFVII
jgi:aminopeptidase N